MLKTFRAVLNIKFPNESVRIVFPLIQAVNVFTVRVKRS